MLHMNGIENHQTSAYNPTANAICERMHKTVADHIRTLFRAHPPDNMTQVNDIVDTALASASFALRASVNRAMQVSPSAVVFRRDMILNIPVIADLELLRNRRQLLIDERLRHANLQRHSFDYQPGQQVLLRLPDVTKLGRRTNGPFNIDRVHTNGTVTIRLRPHVTERVNIRRVFPYRT